MSNPANAGTRTTFFCAIAVIGKGKAEHRGRHPTSEKAELGAAPLLPQPEPELTPVIKHQNARSCYTAGCCYLQPGEQADASVGPHYPDGVLRGAGQLTPVASVALHLYVPPKGVEGVGAGDGQ
eukprot:CAMPEP_0204494012 /NCGR_PEP_ID=MMETSP0471-20130131/83344_1 /ASSEMBLY_ACC=CAM_ASM_000602 /TAXON_ID=2969 /ORGANISM="Oxyrrhis marina" /LENGTH=123 /DNA_ID=CAMNT_0051498187 /DNA_START=86 /DNA_END=457 /DNA_ORIENTATION=+